MNKYLIMVIIILLITLGVVYKQMQYSNGKWETAEANVKAYASQLTESESKNTALQLTVSQFGYFKDSVLQELNETRKQLNIKDKNLKALQQVSSSFGRIDTLILRDTIFRNSSLSMDTTLGDKWYSVQVGLQYPSSISLSPRFISKKNIIVSTRRETVNPPKKFIFFRWFQKKHTVLSVDVVEMNPYATDESSRYIEIIK